MFQYPDFLRILMINQSFIRDTAIHTHHPVEYQFYTDGGCIQLAYRLKALRQVDLQVYFFKAKKLVKILLGLQKPSCTTTLLLRTSGILSAYSVTSTTHSLGRSSILVISKPSKISLGTSIELICSKLTQNLSFLYS